MLLLRRALLSNSAFSALSGVVMIAAATPLSKLMGIPQTWIMAALGFGLLVFAAEVFRHARGRRVGGPETRCIIALDIGWVILSVALIVALRDLLSAEARGLIAIVAIAVAGFATAQYLGLKGQH